MFIFGEIHVFFEISWVGLFRTNRACLFKNFSFWKYSIQKLTQFSELNNVLDVEASNPDSFLWTDTYVSSTQLNSPIWNKAHLNFKTKRAGRFPFKNYLNYHRETMCWMVWILTQMCFLERYMCVHNSAAYTYLEQIEPISTLKNLSCGKYSFHKLPQISQVNNVLDAFPLQHIAFFRQIQVFLKLSWIGLFWTKTGYRHLEKPNWQQTLLSEMNSVLSWKQCARWMCS
jgi:hypothetical protein